jgi:hypothetical protein
LFSAHADKSNLESHSVPGAGKDGEPFSKPSW